MFDCKQVIYAQRTATLVEGQKLKLITEVTGIGAICTALHYFPPEGEGDKYRVLALFEDGTQTLIFDMDEIKGQDVKP